MIHLMRLALLFTYRDVRAGELRLLALAIMMAVAALSSVGLFVERAARAVQEQAQRSLGGDLVIVSDHAGLSLLAQKAADQGLRVSRTVTFPSMVATEPSSDRGGPASLLVSVKAVSEDYPLRGAVRLTPGHEAAEVATQKGPSSGTIWLEPAALRALGVAPGATLRLGEARFRVDQVLTFEPDRSLSFVNLAPRLIMSLADLDATELLAPGSRVTWRLLLAGESEAVRRFASLATPQLTRGQRIESVESARPELRVVLERSQQFLGLVAVSAALLAAVAMALAARRFVDRHWSGCAVMRALGMTRRRLLGVLLLELSWVGLGAGFVGVGLGLVGHLVLAQLAAPILGLAWPSGTIWPALQALLAGWVLLLGFALIPLLRLAAVPPWRALRRESIPPDRTVWRAVIAALVSCIALIFWFSQDLELGWVMLAGFGTATILFVLGGWGALAVVGAVYRGLRARCPSSALVMALASLRRHRAVVTTQIVALALGMMALVLLTVTRDDLLQSWQRAVPADAPNRFIINIQPAQREAITAAFKAAQIDADEFYPMVRGRLVAINDQPVATMPLRSARAQRLLERELNLSFMTEPQKGAPTKEGRWIDPNQAEVSVEAGVMRTLGLALDDRLTFDVAGELLHVQIVGSRHVSWDSMRPNFFMVLSPSVLMDRPQTWITALHLPAARSDWLDELVARFPNLTIFDTTALLQQVRDTVGEMVQVIEAMFGFALVSGLFVAYCALVGSYDERVAEAALLRALGASRAQLQRAHLVELAMIGGVAGLLSGLAALATGAVLAEWIFEFSYSPRWFGLPGCVLVGALLSVSAGWWGLRPVLQQPPLISLRER